MEARNSVAEHKTTQMYCKSNVFIHPSKDESISGTISIDKADQQTQLVWKPNPSVNDSESHGESCPEHNTNGLSHDLYQVTVPLKDIRSIKRYIPTMGIPHIIVITHSGIAFPPFHFHDGGVREFIHGLQDLVGLVKSEEDPNVFYVHDLNSPPHLPRHHTTHSKPKEIKAIENASWTILEGFSMVTKFARNAATGKLLKDAQSPPSSRVERSHQAQSDLGTFELLGSKEESVSKTERLPELTAEEWKAYFDEQGRISDPMAIKKRIFYGGVAPDIRVDVWKFLLNYYPWESTAAQREKIRAETREKYTRWKKLYTGIDGEQEFKFTKFKLRQHAVEKDVVRTDRALPYYAGDHNSNLNILDDILNVYCFYNSDLGYVQGMNELASPILFVMNDEMDAFWCFKCLMDVMEVNFHKDQNGMHKQITQLRGLVKSLDPGLYKYLEDHECLNFFYCFRWLLINFKREFSFDTIQRYWEISWTNYLTPNLQLFVAAAILIKNRKTIITEQMEFDDLLKFTNEMAGRLNMAEVLEDAEYLFNVYTKQSLTRSFDK